MRPSGKCADLVGGVGRISQKDTEEGGAREHGLGGMQGGEEKDVMSSAAGRSLAE